MGFQWITTIGASHIRASGSFNPCFSWFMGLNSTALTFKDRASLFDPKNGQEKKG
jgi:hypothetical protein